MDTTHPPKSSWRFIQSSNRAQLSGPFSSQEELLDILLPTLDLLRLLPTEGISHNLVLRHSAQKVFGTGPSGDVDGYDDDNDDSDAGDEFRRAFSGRSWLQDVQQAILGPIVQDWQPHLTQSQDLWRHILKAWFAPLDSVSSDTLPNKKGMVTLLEEDAAEVDPQRQINASLVTASGLQVCLAALSRITTIRSSGSQSAVPPSLLAAVTDIASFYADPSFDLLGRLLLASESEPNQARRSLGWQESLQALVSLPSRVANALQGDVPRIVSTPIYFTNLAWQSAQAVARLSTVEHIPSTVGKYALLSQLLAKLLRAGQVNSSFWAAAMRSIVKHSQYTDDDSMAWSRSYSRAWQSVRSSLDAADRRQLDLRLLAFLDQSAECKGSLGLVANSERGKPVLVGKHFLGSDAAKAITVLTSVLKLFWNKDFSEEQGQEDEDGEADEAGPAMDIRSYMLEEEKHYTPCMARTFAALLAEVDPDGLSNALLDAIGAWGNATRVTRATVDQEQYLTTLVISLLARSRQCITSASLNVGPTISHRQDFIEGVAAHLGHLDPHIRLMGMLLAELVSEIAHGSTKGAAQSKKLEFSRASWDGTGEGKEEARVLRALFHSSPLVSSAALSVSRASALAYLGIAEEVTTIPAPPRTPQVRARLSPRTRLLPAKVPVAFHKDRKSASAVLISEVGSSDEEPVITRQAAIMSDSGASSSSESDSSDDDRGITKEEGPESHGLAGLDMPLNPASAFGKQGREKAQQEPEHFELDTRKRRRPPVYIWELSAMLREKDRDGIRVALKSAEALIRRKTGWGGEVDENCIDLAFGLIGLQNNYRFKHFNSRRTRALQALVVASPRLATGAMIEQLFTDSWSIVQRFAILNALAAGSRELAGLTPIPGLERQGEKVKGERTSGQVTVTSLASSLADVAISRAKQEGEERVPEIKREKALKITSQRGLRGGGSSGRAGIQAMTGGESSHAVMKAPNPERSPGDTFASLPGTLTRPKEKYIDVAGSVFLFPLLNRLSAHIRETSTRFSRLSHYGSSSGGGGGHGTGDRVGRIDLGLGSGINVGLSSLFDPQVLAALLDTLSILAHCAGNASDFLALLAPDILEVTMLVATRALPLSLAGSGGIQDDGRGGGGGGKDTIYTIHGACLSLILVVLDLSYHRDQGRTLLSTHSTPLLEDVGAFAGQIFEEVEDQGRVEGATAAAAATTAAGGRAVARAARCSAAVVLRIEEMRSRWREERTRIKQK